MCGQTQDTNEATLLSLRREKAENPRYLIKTGILLSESHATVTIIQKKTGHPDMQVSTAMRSFLEHSIIVVMDFENAFLNCHIKAEMPAKQQTNFWGQQF